MTFIEYLIERKYHVRSNSCADKAGTSNVEDFVRDQISNLNAASKEAEKEVNYHADKFRHKDIDDNIFGDIDLSDLARSHDISVRVPIDIIKKEMAATDQKVKKNRQMILDLSNKKRHQNGGKM